MGIREIGKCMCNGRKEADRRKRNTEQGDKRKNDPSLVKLTQLTTYVANYAQCKCTRFSYSSN